MDIFYPETSKLLVVKKLVHASFQRPLFKVVFFVLLTMSLSFSVKADYTIPVNTIVDAATINTQSGTLHIYGTLRVNSDVTFNSPNPIRIILYGPAPGGGIEWAANKTLAFPAGTTISFVNAPRGLAGGGNSASAILQIGTVRYAAANDNSNNVLFSFAQINLIGGTASVTTSAITTYCAGDSIQLQANSTRPNGSLFKVKWKTQSTLGAFSVNDTSIAVNTVLTGIPAGTEVITCELYVNGNNNNNQINYILAARSTMSMNVKAKNTWLGTSNNWNDPQNWCPQIPSGATDLTIPVMANNIYPIIGSSTASVKNLTIATGASVIVTGTGVLEISGALVNNGTLNATSGTLRFNGTSAQTIAGSNFIGRTLKNLTVSNPAGLNISNAANDTLNITGTLSFGNATATLNTGNNLTLNSSATATANVGQLGVGNIISGNVTVERYISTGRKWRFLSVPVVESQTFRQTWQENLSSAGGYGFILGNPTNAIALGFDATTPGGPTVKTYDAGSNLWSGIPSTSTLIDHRKGYMVFIGGDRAIPLNNARSTVARTRGVLKQQTQAPITLVAAQFTPIGNPYAASIYMANIAKTGGTQDVFYVWDPRLALVGGYQTISRISPDEYFVTPGGGSFGNSIVPIENARIESGQAFLMSSFGIDGSIIIEENDKAPTQNVVFRNPTNFVDQPKIIVKLKNADNNVLDAAILRIDESYSNERDINDILKMQNTNEGVAIVANGKDFVFDSRNQITAADTIHLKLTGIKIAAYKWEINIQNVTSTGLNAFVLDAHKKTTTPINMFGENNFEFNIENIPSSYASNRFKIVFAPSVVLPVSFTNITAQRNNDRSVSVQWKVENEINMDGYQVERSANGTNFETVSSTVAPTNNNAGAASYQHADADKVSSDLFYRIKGLSSNGEIQYSAIVKVGGFKTDGLFTVYPNPVQNKQMNVQFATSVAGNYQITLLGNNGSRVYQQALKLNNNTSTQTIALPSNIAAGRYQLQVQTPDGKMEQQAIFIL